MKKISGKESDTKTKKGIRCRWCEKWNVVEESDGDEIDCVECELTIEVIR